MVEGINGEIHKRGHSMTSLPVTKDYFDEEQTRGDLLWLDEKQIKQIESHGRLKLNNALIAELSYAIDNYVTATGKKAKPPINRPKARRKFRALKRNLDALALFFGQADSPEHHEVRHKLESELWFLARGEHSPRGPERPLVETKRFHMEMAALARAADSALARFEREAQEHRKTARGKSRREFAFDLFLADLEAIYGQATGLRGSFVDFLLAVVETMPPKLRPRLPAGWAEMATPARR